MTETQTKKENKDSEIDLIDIAKKIWSGRRIIIKSMIGFFILGILIIIFSPKEYKSGITLVVETSTSGSGMSSLLQQFGGLAGINLNNTSNKEALAPDLYPEVIKSTPFLLEILKQKVVESKYDSSITVEQYIERYIKPSVSSLIIGNTVGLPGKIITWIRGNRKRDKEEFPALLNDSLNKFEYNPLKISTKHLENSKFLASRIFTEQDFNKSNKFLIQVEIQDPSVSAQLTSLIVKNLTKYIIEYRTKKAKSDMQFINERTLEAENKYYEAQKLIAQHKDRNKNVILSSVQVEEDRLQSEFDLAFSVYSALAKQLEQAKIKVQEETPVFNVIDPVQVPLNKSRPKTNITIIAALLLGCIVGMLIVISKIFLRTKTK